MIKYQIRPGGVRAYWSPFNRYRRYVCLHIYSYPNEVVLVVVKEWKVLARANARLETEVNQLKETIKTLTDRIKEFEYDVVEGRERVDDLCKQLGEAQERRIKRAMKVRNRTESILNICDDLLGEVSDETSHNGDDIVAEPAQSGGVN